MAWTADLRGVAASLLDPRDPALRALAQRRPLRVYADVARCYAIVVAAFALLYALDGGWVALLSFLLVGTQQYALAVIEHDGKHGNLIPDRVANDRFSTWLLCAPLGLDPDFSRKVSDHHQHHSLLGTDPDPERLLYIAADKSTVGSWLFYLTGLSTLPRAVAAALRYGLGGSKASASRHVDGWWPALAVQGLLIIALGLCFPWWYYLVFWVAPIYPLVFTARKVRAFCEHAHPVVPDEAADAARLITYVPSTLERWVFAPMGMNYHGEHHLWPFVPYYNLPALHRLVGANEVIEVRRSYLGFLWTYFQKLPLSR